MTIRTITINDTESFHKMMCQLDEETEYMMFEPGERQMRTKNLNGLKSAIEEAVSGKDLLLVAENDEGKLVGHLWAKRGRLNRVQHTAYIVTGILKAYRCQGIGTQLFQQLEDWARSNGIIRLELTVECENTLAKKLYDKCGFQVEGLRAKSMKINDRYVNEYYMGKILE